VYSAGFPINVTNVVVNDVLAQHVSMDVICVYFWLKKKHVFFFHSRYFRELANISTVSKARPNIISLNMFKSFTSRERFYVAPCVVNLLSVHY